MKQETSSPSLAQAVEAFRREHKRFKSLAEQARAMPTGIRVDIDPSMLAVDDTRLASRCAAAFIPQAGAIRA